MPCCKTRTIYQLVFRINKPTNWWMETESLVRVDGFIVEAQFGTLLASLILHLESAGEPQNHVR